MVVRVLGGCQVWLVQNPQFSGLIFGTKIGTGFKTGSLNPILEMEMKLEFFLNNVFGGKMVWNWGLTSS